MQLLPPASGLTLTTTETLARSLRRVHALARKHSGAGAWEVPAIHSLRRWCREQWLQTWPEEQLLHAVQELALWQSVIEADPVAANVLSTNALAREARAMGRLVTQFEINPAAIPRFTDEHHAFVRWQQAVTRQLKTQRWVTETEIPGRVATLLDNDALKAPASLQIVGPQEALSPLEKRLLRSLEQAGCAVQAAAASVARARITASAHDDDAQHYHAVACSLRDLLLPFVDRDELPTILVCCEDPTTQRDALEAAFRPVLAPWLLLPGEGQRPIPWRSSQGRSLDQQPLVAVALTICGLSENQNTLDSLSRLLLASVLWTPAQREQTAKIDFLLRDLSGSYFSLRLLARLATEPLDTRFQSLLDAIRAEPRRALPSSWAARFAQRLSALGWPGERALPSAVFQAQEQWQLALSTFSAMDRQLGEQNCSSALSWLREIVAQQNFEPRADHDQPILITTLAEAAALPADHLFILDATDAVLPPAPRRYPLLATEALVAAGVPDATAASTLHAATEQLMALRTQAQQIHLSYAKLDERGAQRQATRLFGELVWSVAEFPAGQTAAQRAATNPQLYQPADDPVPPVVDPLAEKITGGVKIFKDYVEAPFFAFCHHRLGIESLPAPTVGIPATAQGKVIHEVLEKIWGELRHSDALNGQTGEQLLACIDPPLEQAMQRFVPPDRFGRALRRAEQARIRDVVLQWLQHEQRRPEAFEVIEREHEIRLRFEGLELRLCIDRVDRVASPLGERLLIIDYKTGRNAETRGWKADALQEPQLPIYATSASLAELGITQVNGIAFAHLKDGHPALAAATDWGMGLIDPKRRFAVQSWPEQLDAWRDALTLVARGFLAGDAGIGPRRDYRYSLNKALLDLVRES